MLWPYVTWADPKLPNIFLGQPTTIGLSIQQENGIGEPLFNEDELRSLYKEFEKRLVQVGFVPESFREVPRLIVEFTNFRQGDVSAMTYRLAFQERCSLGRDKSIGLICNTYEIRNGHMTKPSVVKQLFRQEIMSQLDWFLTDRAQSRAPAK
jgi:hypothetical protein